MSDVVLRASGRALAVIAAVVVPSYFITFSGALPVWQNALDVLAFAFAGANIVLNLKRFGNVFTAKRLNPGHVHLFSWQMMMIGVCVSAWSAIHWRASGHLVSLNDGGTRVVFRVLYDIGAAGFLFTAAEFRPEVAWGRWRAIVLITAAIGLAAVVLINAERIRPMAWPSDDGASLYDRARP